MRRGLVVFGLYAVAGCAGGTETGNPVVPLEMRLSVHSSDPSSVAIRSDAGDTRVAEAWVAFGELMFLEQGECGSLEDFPAGSTQLVADLASPDVHIDLEVPSHRYCGLITPLMGMSVTLPDGAPTELAASSILVRGTRADGTPFSLVHAEQDEIEVVAEQGSFEVSRDGAPLLLSFDVAAWLQGVNLDDAQPDGDGVIRIDASRNAALHQIFDLNLECSLELYTDDDGDGRVDPSADTRVGRCAAE